MAVPKKRTGHSAQGHRRSNWKATKPEVTKCQNCGETVLTHTVCTACGTYKGQPVSLKDKVEEVVTTKKATKKPAKVEEVKVEETVETVEATASEVVEAETEVVETKEETTEE
ncbi:MAG: 50S ribosomal protein L32 [Candidatus Gastranaerophilales bacterium]